MSELSDDLHDWIFQRVDTALLADGFEAAIVGVAERCGQPTLIVYDAERCIEILMKRDGLDRAEATEIFEYNTLGAWMGKDTPLFLWRYEAEACPSKTSVT